MADESDSKWEGLWDALEVARYLKFSRSYVYELSDRGILPCRRFGSARRYVPAEIRAIATSSTPLPVLLHSRRRG